MPDISQVVDVKKVAKLARLHLDPNKSRAAAAYLSEIITYVQSLSDTETKNVAPFDGAPLDAVLLRPDETRAFPHRFEILKSAATTPTGLVEAPPIFVKNE